MRESSRGFLGPTSSSFHVGESFAGSQRDGASGLGGSLETRAWLEKRSVATDARHQPDSRNVGKGEGGHDDVAGSGKIRRSDADPSGSKATAPSAGAPRPDNAELVLDAVLLPLVQRVRGVYPKWAPQPHQLEFARVLLEEARQPANEQRMGEFFEIAFRNLLVRHKGEPSVYRLDAAQPLQVRIDEEKAIYSEQAAALLALKICVQAANETPEILAEMNVRLTGLQREEMDAQSVAGVREDLRGVHIHARIYGNFLYDLFDVVEKNPQIEAEALNTLCLLGFTETVAGTLVSEWRGRHSGAA